MKVYVVEIDDEMGYAVVGYSSKEKAIYHSGASAHCVATYIGEIEMTIPDFYEGIELAIRV